MKNLYITLLAIALIATPSFAAKSAKKTASSVTAKVEEPIGFGLIKLGMSKEQIESLPSDGGVYLTEKMIPSPKSKTDGTYDFSSKIAQPLTQKPISATLSFDAEDKLYSMILDFDEEEAAFTAAIAQLEKKWGLPERTNKEEDELCLYKNGANFKLPQQLTLLKWAASKNQEITTFFNLINLCPSSLTSKRFTQSMRWVSISTKSIKKSVDSASQTKEVKSVF